MGGSRRDSGSLLCIEGPGCWARHQEFLILNKFLEGRCLALPSLLVRIDTTKGTKSGWLLAQPDLPEEIRRNGRL